MIHFWFVITHLTFKTELPLKWIYYVDIINVSVVPALCWSCFHVPLIFVTNISHSLHSKLNECKSVTWILTTLIYSAVASQKMQIKQWRINSLCFLAMWLSRSASCYVLSSNSNHSKQKCIWNEFTIVICWRIPVILLIFQMSFFFVFLWTRFHSPYILN